MASNSVKILKSLLDFSTKGRGFDTVVKGMRVVSGGEGKCRCEMTVTEDHLNRGGTLHGGMSATLVDVVSTMALMTTGEGNPGVSVDLSVAYMKGCKPESEILIDAEALRVGQKLAFLTVDIKQKDSGVLLAQGKHTKFVGQS